MEPATMGKVLVAAKIENVHDVFNASQGHLKPEEVRRVVVTDALVDTGASTLSLPTRMIAPLGLQPVRTRKARTSAGTSPPTPTIRSQPICSPSPMPSTR